MLFLFQVPPDKLKLQIGLFCILCMLLRTSTSKKNILTLLDELYVCNWNIFVFLQGFVYLLSLLCEARNDYVCLAFYVILYSSLALGFGVTIGHSFFIVLIIASKNRKRGLKRFVSAYNIPQSSTQDGLPSRAVSSGHCFLLV